METYVVRVYRTESKSSRIMVGTVENIHGVEKKAFNNRDELWEILCHKAFYLDSVRQKPMEHCREEEKNETSQ